MVRKTLLTNEEPGGEAGEKRENKAPWYERAGLYQFIQRLQEELKKEDEPANLDEFFKILEEKIGGRKRLNPRLW